ncbi:MAG: PLDc N-terminal domain-containing protein [Actinomycetota bacterium]
MLEIEPTSFLMPVVATILFGVIPWVITILALVDAIRVSDDSQYRAGTKLIWVLVILFFNCLGAIIYYAVGRPQIRY